MKKKGKYLFLSIILCVTGYFTYTVFKDPYIHIPDDVKLTYSYASWAIDVSDKIVLSNSAAHIFVGSVEHIKGSRVEDQTIAKTDAVVRIIHNIKGANKKNRIIISQMGGYNPEEHTRDVLIHSAPLKKGETYIFYTSNQSNKGIYPIIAEPYGNIRLQTPSTLEAKIHASTITGDKGNLEAINDYDVVASELEQLLSSPFVKEAQRKALEAEKHKNNRL